jgi:hypothetical protein
MAGLFRRSELIKGTSANLFAAQNLVAGASSVGRYRVQATPVATIERHMPDTGFSVEIKRLCSERPAAFALATPGLCEPAGCCC